MSPHRSNFGLAVGLALLLAGCVSTSARLKSKFAEEKTCPEDRVSVVEQGANVYRASGCNESVEYVCSTFASSGGQLPCEERGGVKNAPSGAPTRSPGMDQHQKPPGPAY